MSNIWRKRQGERGVTALFIVLFAALLLSIITVSFISMMIRDQQRSTDDEQSQSAYDAALAGVEDAKRVMASCNSGTAAACTAIANKQCDTVQTSGVIGSTSDTEVPVQSTTAGDGSRLNQAYTCVIIKTDAPDYLGKLAHDESTIIPLRGVSNFSRVTISWHTDEDATTSSPVDEHPSLPPLASWQADRPALLRVQLMQYSEGAIGSANFDTGANARTLYLYPQLSGSNTASFNLDGRRTSAMESQAVRCTSGGFSPVSGYACEVTLELPDASMTNRTGYLRLTSLYAGTHFRIQLQDGTVNLDGVQPVADVTGRANDLFRRVEARIEMVNEGFPYPRATVDITNNFCKTLAVSNTADGYDPGSCDPTRAGSD